jgi:CheY-like chemotaxis protein
MQTGNSGKTILVADDDLEVCNYFETLLKIRGYSVLLADSGEEVLRFLAEGRLRARRVHRRLRGPARKIRNGARRDHFAG